MTPMRLAIVSMLTAFAVLGDAVACTVPKSGYNMDMDDLISEAKTIVLVRLQSSSPERHWTKYILETVEVIKGKADPSYHFLSSGSNASDNDFVGHTAMAFWTRPADERPAGRSEWPCCICGPDHSFRTDREYLYFPDKLGAMKSAELIRDREDRWLQYVRSKVLAANPALQGTRKGSRAPERERWAAD
jgi:hypothetical protein